MEYENEFYYKNLSFNSVDLLWEDKNKEEGVIGIYEYELYQKEKEIDNDFKKIYQGEDIKYIATNLESNKTYIFKLNIMKEGKIIKEKEISITTLKTPMGKPSEERELKQKEPIIKNCSKIIFEEIDENVIQGNFEEIIVRIAYENENKLYYISFDIKHEHFEQFFNNFIEERDKDFVIPCHFIIKKLPTLLIFNLLEKGPVIFTGKRMGGVIASSLAFYILFIGKSINKNYGNAFIKREKNCLGVVTFGSPSFLQDLFNAEKMKEYIPYFNNIIGESDYIPEIIDFIKKKMNYKDIINIIQKEDRNNVNEINNNNEINEFNNYLKKINFTENNLKNEIIKFSTIPFGTFFMIKSRNNSSLIPIIYNFKEFYYFKKFKSKNQLSHLEIYENLKSNIDFNKEPLVDLESKNIKLKLIKIIRRIKETDETNKKNKNKEPNEIRGIIKFTLDNNNIISPDIIYEIELKSDNEITYIIKNKDIYYDNNEITAYMNNLNKNINKVIIFNNFKGEMEVENIINIQGSGPTKKMIEKNIQKLFLIPFFKLFEIFYASLKDGDKFDEDKYNELKEKYFGNNFDDIKILKPFEKQIESLDQLLFLSRPDILGKYENEFIKEYAIKYLYEHKEYLENKFKIFYDRAKKLQNVQAINCMDSELDSFAKKYSFPNKLKNKEIKKFFFCNRSLFDEKNFISNKYIDPEIKFFIKDLIKEALKGIEKDIENEIKNNIEINIENNINNDLINKIDDKRKKYLSDNIGKFFNKYIIGNIYFIYILILTSIESGDEIKFNKNYDWDKFIRFLPYDTSLILYRLLNVYKGTNKENDFVKNYSSGEIERLNLKYLFNKIKTKNLVKSNFSLDNISNNDDGNVPDYKKILNCFFPHLIDISQTKSNKIKDFSKYSEKQISGKEYYEKFLEIFNNLNDFLEDIEISIYDNLKEENENRRQNYLPIKEMMDNLISDEESKKGFKALIRQSYFLGKIRCSIVSIYFI